MELNYVIDLFLSLSYFSINSKIDQLYKKCDNCRDYYKKYRQIKTQKEYEKQYLKNCSSIKYLFNDRHYKKIKYIKFLFNEDY
jgi:hypothetical protein